MKYVPKTWRDVLTLVEHGDRALTPGLLVKRMGWPMQQAAQVLNDMVKSGILRHEQHPSHGLIFTPAATHPGQSLIPYGMGTAVMKAQDPEHNAVLSAVLSVLFPGLGQIYNGQVKKGLATFFGTLFLWIVLLGWATHLWSVFDAYHTGKRIKHGEQWR